MREAIGDTRTCLTSVHAGEKHQDGSTVRLVFRTATVALNDHVACAIHQVKVDVVSSDLLEQRCVFDRDLAVGCPVHEDDAMCLL